MFTNWLQRLKMPFLNATRGHTLRREKPYRRRLGLEPLEDRIMLDGQTFTANFTTDSLTPAPQGQTSNLTLRQAVALANASPDSTIVLTGGATYAPLYGAMPITGNFQIQGNGATIDLEGEASSFADINGSANVQMANLTIENGGATLEGGALAVTGSASATFQNVTLLSNHVFGLVGGSDNGAPTDGGFALGGAVYIDTTGEVNFAQSQLLDNTATGGTGGVGNFGAPGGEAGGGAVYISGGQVQFTQTTLNSNFAEGGQTGNNGNGFEPGYADGNYGVAAGGAVFISNGATVTFDNSTFADNEAAGATGASSFDDHNGEDGGQALGGAVYIANFGGSVQFTNGSLSKNEALGGLGGDAGDSGSQGGQGGNAEGGAIFVQNGNLSLTGVSLSANNTYGGQTGWSESGTKTGNGDPSAPVLFTNDPDPYGSSQGGALFAAGTGTILVSSSQLTGNQAVGRVALSEFFQNNGEDAGNAQGGAVYISMSGGSFTINNDSTLDTNAAVGRQGGNAGSGSYDLSGKGGDAQGGAVYLDQGTLSIDSSELGSNTATGGMSGGGQYGVVAAAAPAANTPTPTRDPDRNSLAQGGAVYVNSGSIELTNATLANNQAVAANAQDNQGGALGRSGASAQGGGVYLANPSGTVDVTGATFSTNSANGGNGGAAANSGGTGGEGGDGVGGAIYLGAGR